MAYRSLFVFVLTKLKRLIKICGSTCASAALCCTVERRGGERKREKDLIVGSMDSLDRQSSWIGLHGAWSRPPFIARVLQRYFYTAKQKKKKNRNDGDEMQMVAALWMVAIVAAAFSVPPFPLMGIF